MKKLFSVYDTVACYYTPVLVLRTNLEAERAFISATLDSKSFISKDPEAFTMYCVGEFDEETGLVNGYEQPELIISGLKHMQALAKKAKSFSETQVSQPS